MSEDDYLDKTDEFSFILKPSEYGIGVFATHNIKKDTYLRLFGKEKNTRIELEF